MKAISEIKDRVKNIFVKNEVLKNAYLDTLSTSDRINIKSFLYEFASPDLDFQNERIAIVAYGSSVRPPEKRNHPVGDIDLRIISSAEPDSWLQKSLIQTSIKVVRQFVKRQGWTFKYYPKFTMSHRLIEKPDRYFLDYSNNDPSFELKPNNGGLPLHISISGPGQDTLDRHIFQERRQRQYFSILTTIT